MAAILANPRYTGRQVWNRQRGDREHSQDMLPGLTQVRRLAAGAQWAISAKPTHPGLVSERDFVAAQAVSAVPQPGDGNNLATLRPERVEGFAARHCMPVRGNSVLQPVSPGSGMMSGVSAAPPPLDPFSPSMPLRTMGADGSAAPDRTRRLMWAAVAGAVFAVVLAAVTVMYVGGSAERSGSAAIPASSDTVATHASEAVVSDAAAPSPSASPSAKPSPRPSPRPGELITRLHTTVLGLVRSGQLAPEAGEELTKRLREAAEKLADGEADKAREELIGFAEKVVKLRKEEKLSSAGYDTVAAELTQLAQVLPSR